MGVTTNLALYKSTASSSYVLPYDASRAVNGTYGALTPTSRWLCNKLPGWMSVDLGAYYWINRWVVRHMSVAGWKLPDYNMTDFKLQGSNDNRNWRDLDLVVGSTASITDRTITAVEVRYVRVYVTGGLRCNPQLASIMEFEVYPAPASQYLSGLTLSSGTLSPTFASTIFAYTATVGYDITSITVTPVAVDVHAIIRVNNVVVQSNHASPLINLNVGSNTITVNVIASDGSAQATYTVTVTRAGSQYLSGLTLSSGTVSPAFAGRTTYDYTASVGYDVSSITVTPTAEYSGSTITVNGTTVESGHASGPISLSDETNPITIVVTAAVTGTQQIYNLTVTKASSPYLTDLKLASGKKKFNLDPEFSNMNLLYSTTVSTTSVDVTPIAEDGAASITVNGTGTSSGHAVTVPINPGVNQINVVVTSSVGNDSKTYVINATK